MEDVDDRRMTDEDFKSAVRSVFPTATVRCWIGGPPRDTQSHWIDLEADTSWTYDDLKRLTEALGTTDLRFEWSTDPGYSEYTPGGPDQVTIHVRWNP